MSSAEHLSSGRLLDYYLGDPTGEEASTAETEAVEAHLFECHECSEVLDAIHRTAAAVVGVVRAGEVGSGGTTGLLNRMSRDRLNVRHYTIEPGETVACAVDTRDDFMAGRFVLPEGDFGRIDMRVLGANDEEMMRVEDVVVDARSRHAIVFIPARPVLGEESGVTHYVLVTDDGGAEREVGRYSMDHTALRDG